MSVTLSEASATTAGTLLISIVGIAYGGTFLLKVVGGRVPLTAFQQSFFRAGHAHAGVLVTLALVCTVLVEATSLTGIAAWLARSGVAFAAILMSAGFFLSAIGPERTSPNRLVVLIWAGAASLVAGVLSLGIGLLVA